MSKANTISIVTIRAGEPSETHSMFPFLTKMVIKSSQLATKELSENLSSFVQTLSQIVESLPETSGRHEVDEITFSLSVDGSGKISLIGELAAGVTSGISLTFKKKET